MSLKKAFKVAAGEARFGNLYKMKGLTLNHLATKVSGKDTDGQLVLFEQTSLTYKGGPPLHIHLNQDEWFFVLEGHFKFRVEEEEFDLQQGDMIFLPRGIPHAFIQLSELGRMMVCFQPAGKMEAFFALTDQWKTIPSKEEMEIIFREHDMQIAGPPLKAD